MRALRARLGLDSGHVSRLLRSLEAEGLIRLDADPNDRRVRIARLTKQGRTEHAQLNHRSDDLAREMLASLDARRREELVAAMATVERLLASSMVELRAVDPDHPDAQRCRAAYFEELHRRSAGTGFDPDASIPTTRDQLLPPAGHFLVAYLHGDPVGCGGVKHPPGAAAAAAEIKRMWVSDAARGRGVGRRLLSRLEELAAASGATTARLDTNGVLTEAISMYRSAGYREVPPFNDEAFADHWFEKRLRPLSPPPRSG